MFHSSAIHFNPLPPHGGRLRRLLITETSTSFQSTPSAWRETCVSDYMTTATAISIHSLRMEGDYHYSCTRRSYFHFNPLPPHGGRPADFSFAATSNTFQSTPSAWRETERKRLSYNIDMHFNPLPPHGGRLLCFSTFFAGFYISIHSLRMEGDNLTRRFRQAVYHFNPLPPHGGRRIYISKRIHFIHFNPLPPHGGRLWTTRYYGYGDFISIHSLRMEGDSPYFAQIPAEEFISIHSLRMEGDVSIFNFNNSGRHFNPLPPHGGRPFPGRRKKFHHAFQSTPSAWRETISVQKL